jgi:hypothetical protein
MPDLIKAFLIPEVVLKNGLLSLKEADRIIHS